jgi:hypothetical protein
MRLRVIPSPYDGCASASLAAFARALLEDIASPDLSLTTALISGFICRRETLLRHLSDTEFREATDCAEFKTVLLAEDVRAVAAQIPELAALSLSHRLVDFSRVNDGSSPAAPFRSIWTRPGLGQDPSNGSAARSFCYRPAAVEQSTERGGGFGQLCAPKRTGSSRPYSVTADRMHE